MSDANKTIVRLRRVLDLASFLMARPGVTVDEAARQMDADPGEILRDLDMLFLCGLPPYTPTDLFEVYVDGESIWLTGAEPLEQPFGMSKYEAIRSLAAARIVLGLPGGEGTPELAGAAEKLEAAVGEEPLVIDREPDVVLGSLERALAAGKAIEITYLSAARNEETVRVVDPCRLATMSGRTYLSAWCRNAGAMRSFRTDRIREVVLLEEEAKRVDTDISIGYAAARDDLRATLELGPEAAWVVRGVPLEQVEPAGDGYRVVVASPDREFLVRLVLQVGSALRSVEPAWLREDVAARAEALWQLTDEAARLPRGESSV